MAKRTYSDEYKKLGTAIAKQYIADGYVWKDEKGRVQVGNAKWRSKGVMFGEVWDIMQKVLVAEGMKATDVPEVVASMEERKKKGWDASERSGMLDHFYTKSTDYVGTTDYVGKEIRRLFEGEPLPPLYTKKKKTEKKVYERWVVKNVNPNRDCFVNYPQHDGSVIQHIPFWLQSEYTIKWDGGSTADVLLAEWYEREKDALWAVDVLTEHIVEGRMFKECASGSVYEAYRALIESEEYKKCVPEYKAVKVKITIEEV